MHGSDWRWKIGQVMERLRSRYEHIGRKTAAPFLAIVYPPEVEVAFFKEWYTQTNSLPSELEVIPIDILDVTQGVVSEIGVEDIVDSLANPMPGDNPINDLGQLWVHAILGRVHKAYSESSAPKPVVVLERLAALYPVTGPRDVMQALWDGDQTTLTGPVVILIPGTLTGTRTYSFVDAREELMYRGDLL